MRTDDPVFDDYGYPLNKAAVMSLDPRRQDLRDIEELCARQVCGGGYITRQEADLLWKLRAEVGQKYDAVNGCWAPLDSE